MFRVSWQHYPTTFTGFSRKAKRRRVFAKTVATLDEAIGNVTQPRCAAQLPASRV
jgi:hypothetical protein